MKTLQQRSSILSSVVTGLVGWIGFVFIGPLIFGFKVPAAELLVLSVASALAQVAFLRAGFFLLRMDRHLLAGAFWGTVTALALYFVAAAFYKELSLHAFYWILVYLYIGPPVGAFLSYFYIDDKKIADAAASEKTEVKYGRDAHWLEPFVFGAAAYLLAFVPFRHFDLSVNVFLVGAMCGVFAAGASHFSPDKWKFSPVLFPLLILGPGSIFGILTAFLFRGYSDELLIGNFAQGIIAGLLTFLLTFLRGRQLAVKEKNNEL